MRFGLVLLLPLLTACPAPQTDYTSPATTIARQQQDKSAGAFADLDPWVLKTTDPNTARGNHGIYLANGSIGSTVDARGVFHEILHVAGVYDAQESFDDLGAYLSFPGGIASAVNFEEQTLDIKHGVLVTRTASGTVTSFASAANPLALIVQERANVPRTVSSGSNTFTTSSKVTVTDQTAKLTGNNQIVQTGRNETDGSVTSYLAAAQPGRKADAVLPASLNYNDLIARHEAAWGKRWADADIVIEGDPEAQQLVHKLQFDLMQSTREGGDDSIAPEALSGNFYKGHIFWDAEVWMLPALLPQRPELARTILDYRYKHLDAARAQARAQGCKGADFPWESAATGRETAPAGFSKGRHVTAGVGWASWQYYLATGDKKWMQSRGWPLLSDVADYFATRAKKNAITGKYDIADVTGPDEFQIGVTNNTYTNAMTRDCLRYAGEAALLLGKPANPRWKMVADKLALPFDKARGVYLKCDGDAGKPGTKQADGELLLWPAQLPMDARTQAATFDFHKSRVIKNGPAMTASIHALVAARLGRAEEAEQYFRDSYRPFVRGPFLLFSEKRSLDRCVFTTGAGGVLQSVLYGFGGLDYTQKSGVIPGPVALPKSWTKLTITGIHRLGKRYTLTVTPRGRTLTAEK